MEIEGWYFIDDHEVCVDFSVTWRHPEQGIGGVYRGGGCGFDASCEFGTEHLAWLVESTVFDDARIDFAHDGAHFARDLRIAPVRDTTDAETTPSCELVPRIPGDVAALSFRRIVHCRRHKRRDRPDATVDD